MQILLVVCYTLTFLTLCLFVPALMASHEGVGVGQKSRFFLLREKLNERKKSGDPMAGTSAAIQSKIGAGTSSPRPPPVAEKKRKKTTPKDGGSSRLSSPKRSRVSEDASYQRLMGSEMQIYDGMSITISQEEANLITETPVPTLMKAFAEYQSRALVIGRHIGHELIKVGETEDLEAEVALLKKQLRAANSEKEKFSGELGDCQKQLQQATSDRKSWRNRCLEAEEKVKKTVEEVSALKRALTEMKTANADLDKEVWELRESVVEEHELGFRKALRQAALLFEIPLDDDHFDVGKDVYQKSLVRIEDIPPIPNQSEDMPSTPSTEAAEGGKDDTDAGTRDEQ